MKYLIAVFIVIIFVSLFGVAQPIRIQGNNSPTNFLDAPCGVPGICPDCIDFCPDGCDESVCAICVELNCKEEIPVDEIPEEKLSTNPRGKKVTKKPSNASRGWHLKGYHVDDNGDVYRYGQYRPEEKIVADILEEQDNPPKKA